MHSRIDEPDIPSGIAVFGSVDATGECSMLYFDERGVSRRYEVSLWDHVWKWWRNAPGFSQRFAGAIAAAGRTIVSRARARARRVGRWAVLGVLCAPAASLRTQEARLRAEPAGATLELLASAVGAASRREQISVVGRALNCDASSGALDSASVQACVALVPNEATLLLVTYARALGRAMGDWPGDLARELPACEGGEEWTGSSRRGPPPRDRFARISAPVVGERDGQWEGRITIELSCRVPGGAGRTAVRTIAREYLCRWDGRAWALYQVASRRVSG